MLIDELRQRPHLKLLNDAKVQYVLYTSNKKEVEELTLILSGEWVGEKNHSYDFLTQEGIDIDMVGSKEEVRSGHVNNIIPHLKTHILRGEFRKEDEYVDEFCCYQEHKSSSLNNNVVKHEDKLSSFMCALELLQTKYFIVLKEVYEKQFTVITTQKVRETFKDLMKGATDHGNS